MSPSVCIGCGCDDDHACYDDEAGVGCHWVRLDRAAGVGVCSCCWEIVKVWDAGQRTPTFSNELMHPVVPEWVTGLEGKKP